MRPRDVVEACLADRKAKLAASSHESYQYRLERFLEWCEANDLANINDVTGEDLPRFKQHREEDLARFQFSANGDPPFVSRENCETT